MKSMEKYGRMVVMCLLFFIGSIPAPASEGFEMKGITIWGGSSEYGAGINNSGRLTIEDTTITGNTATISGGGVYNENGTMVMNSGDISHNRARKGGGVYSYHGRTVMNDGSITENRANWGGGIYRDDTIFEFNGGTISKNIRDNIYPPL